MTQEFSLTCANRQYTLNFKILLPLHIIKKLYTPIFDKKMLKFVTITSVV